MQKQQKCKNCRACWRNLQNLSWSFLYFFSRNRFKALVWAAQKITTLLKAFVHFSTAWKRSSDIRFKMKTPCRGSMFFGNSTRLITDADRFKNGPICKYPGPRPSFFCVHFLHVYTEPFCENYKRLSISRCFQRDNKFTAADFDSKFFH